MNAIALSISNTPIRFDDSGRYCLNDLHKAAGGESRHQPAFFIRRDETKELIKELTPVIPGELNSANSQSLNPVVSVEGRKGGTYVVKELVYAYAMWISAKFHVAVIRAYDAMVSSQLSSNPLQLPEPKTKLALPNGLTLEQQDCIKALVKDRVQELPKEKQGGAAIRCWSAIKKKYGCSYKEVPADQFSSVISLVSRLPLVGELLDKHEQKGSTLEIDLDMPDGLRQLTLSFNSNPVLGGRWVLYHSGDALMIKPMGKGEFLTSSEKLAQYVGDSMGGMVDRRHLPKIIESAAKRLSA